MRAGDLIHRIDLQTRSVTRDAVGGDVVTWTTENTVWAAVEPIVRKSHESFSAQQVQVMADILFRIRYYPAITTAYRIGWNGGYYDITAVIDLKGQLTEHNLLAKTQKND